MPDLDATFLETASRELERQKTDAWLLYDFRALNPLAAHLVGQRGFDPVPGNWVEPPVQDEHAVVRRLEEAHRTALPLIGHQRLAVVARLLMLVVAQCLGESAEILVPGRFHQHGLVNRPL